VLDSQEWLDKHYPKETRGNIKELDIASYLKLFEKYVSPLIVEGKKTVLDDNEQLIGELKLEGFVNLEKLFC